VLTGKAIDMMVTSKAVARLTMAIDVKAAKSRHPGLNFSGSSGCVFGFSSELDLTGNLLLKPMRCGCSCEALTPSG